MNTPALSHIHQAIYVLSKVTHDEFCEPMNSLESSQWLT